MDNKDVQAQQQPDSFTFLIQIQRCQVLLDLESMLTITVLS